MEITVGTSDLNRALSITQSIVDRKATMPILMNVLVSVEGDSLKICGSDLEVTSTVTIPAKVKSKGSTTLNAKIFSDLVRELPDGEVTIRLGERERVEIVARGSRFKMVGVSAEEYPSLPGVMLEPKGSISSAALLEMINKTIYATSQDEARFNLNGVCIEVVSDGKGKKASQKLRLAATDGHRLSMITRPVDGLEAFGRVIAPRKGLGEIRKIIGSIGDMPIKLGIEEGFFIVQGADTKLAMRLIDGEFPHYEQVIPSEKGSLAVIPVKEISQALRRSSIMVSDKGKCVRMEFSKDHLKISSSSPELGEAVEEIAIEYNEDPVCVGFNALYVLDFAGSIGEDGKLTVELHGNLGAGTFGSHNDDSYLGIVMPMRLD